MADELNIKLSVGTDVAAWFLFHPEDLAHRYDAPLSWWTEDFAISKEFAAGRMIAVGTDKDGVSTIRFTNRGLTQREQAYARKSAEFRLRVRYGRLYLDGGYALPRANQHDLEHCCSDDRGWIAIPSGDYRAVVHAIAWFEEPGGMDENGYSTAQALTAYVVDVQPVANLEEISPPLTIPDLHPTLYSPDESSQFETDLPSSERLAPPPQKYPLIYPEYPILYWFEVIFPGIQQRLNVGMTNEDPLDPFEILDFWVVVTYSIEEQDIGTLFHINTMPSFWDWGSPYAVLGGAGDQLVRLSRIIDRDGVLWAEIEPYDPPPSGVDSGAIAQLKQQFAHYAETDLDYQNYIEFPSFYAERVASLTTPRELSWWVAHAIALPGEQQQALLHLSDAKRIEVLNHVLEARLNKS